MKIQCYSWGEGEPYVLVVHGWGGRATQFRRFIKPFLKLNYRVIGFDGPAHGKSEGKKATFGDFEDTIKLIYERFGKPTAIIAHSYGGSAVLYAAMNGLPVGKLVNIASPAIGKKIVDTYRHALGAGPKTEDYFYKFVLARYGKPFSEFTALHFVKHLPAPVPLLLVHDNDDKEVGPEHPRELIKAYPQARLLETAGLGHTRILRDNEVIRQIVTFVVQ